MELRQEPFRLEPALPVTAVKTFQFVSPPDVTVKVACEVARCPAWRHGWETTVDERTDLGLAQATWIRQGSARTFTERRTGEGQTVFRFEPGQRCFAEHRTRPQRFFERGGDWRGNPRGEIREHTAAGWLDSFGEHQDRLKTAFEKG